MNRTLILCLAVFFAVVGLALLGGDSQAVAGHGCHGCQGCDGADDCSGCDGDDDCSGKCHGRRFRLFNRCDGNDCNGCDGADECSGRCHGRKRCSGLFSGLRDRLRCHGNKCDGCDGGCDGGCSGGYTEEEAAPEAPAPEGASASYQRVPFGFRNVHFRG